MINLLFSHQMPCSATDLDVFNVLCDFYSQSKLSWNRCVAICANGVASMSGKHLWVAARIRGLVPNITQTHCIIRGAFNKFPDFFCTGIYNCRKLEIFQYVVTILLMR